jgi:hypothetical protein
VGIPTLAKLHGLDYEIRSSGPEGLQIELRGPRIEELKQALARALNTWERAPKWLRDLDKLTEG